ncbi:MAG: hypothetical protein IJE60_09640 [Tyzzerella sp.]|nr:hypothetical protein [Tyzzerella sp.]
MKRKIFTKTALVLSACLMILWCILGTGSSIAWFVDESPEIRNNFNFAEFDLVVSHKTETGYEEVKTDTKIFNDEALYEPGYVQVIYLKIENKGTVGFDYDLAVVPNLQTIVRAKNVYGQEIYLPEFLKFGVVFADTEAELTQKLATRDLAEQQATAALSSYTSKPDNLQAGGEAFAAVIVRMPEEVGNAANYRDNNPPSVELGITVQAMQEGMN